MKKTKQKSASSQYKGVCWDKVSNAWRASIRLNGKLIHLGLFTSEIDAAKSYDKAAVEFFKAFANLNFK